jgi:rhamnosyltransferase
MKNVLVLLAAYNGSAYITEQIESILAQQGVCVRLLISVDLSNDDTYGICIRFASLDARIEVLEYGDLRLGQ